MGKLFGNGQAWPKVKVASMTSFRVCSRASACFAHDFLTELRFDEQRLFFRSMKRGLDVVPVEEF